MPRRRDIQNKKIKPDPLFNNIAISKLTNIIMVDGKKSIAEKIVYEALKILSKKGDGDALILMEKAFQNVSPSVEVKSRRVGGANYQVPVEVNPKRKQSLAMRWIIEAASKRNEKSMTEKLAQELFDASMNKGSAVKKREDVHRMAEANKAFAHYRW